MNAFARAALLATAAVLPAVAAERQQPSPPPQQPTAQKTGKERLSGKDTDEQRVDDCKVPPERRTRPRPTACPWEFGS